MRIGCGGQCPVSNKIEGIGYIPYQNKLFGKNSSRKVMKGKILNYDTYIIYLSPYWSFDGSTNLCPKSSAGCRATCLVTSGQLKNPTPKQAQLDKTSLWINDPQLFLQIAHEEILAITKSDDYKNTGQKYCIRMNGTSDIVWEKKSYTYNGVTYNNIMEAFSGKYSTPKVQFYDYTKIHSRLGKTPSNYHLTFSASEDNTEEWIDALNSGFQVAMVFGSHAPIMNADGTYRREAGSIPKRYRGYKVIDGDDTDLTFLQPDYSKRKDRKTGIIIGLRSKGKAENDVIVSKDGESFVKRDFKGSVKADLNPKTNIPNIISPQELQKNKKPKKITLLKENKIPMKLKKGSAEAKKYMAYLRSLRDDSLSGWEKGSTRFREVGERTRKGDVIVKRRKHTSVKQRDLGKHGSFLSMKTINGTLLKFTPDQLRFLEAEGKKSKGYKYRAKVLWGQEIVLKERQDGSPVQKFIINDWDDATRLAEELNKGRDYTRVKKKTIAKKGTIKKSRRK